MRLLRREPLPHEKFGSLNWPRLMRRYAKVILRTDYWGTVTVYE